MSAPVAIVLAGGRSSRMGQDKALINLGSETLIQRTCRLALACADSVYVVTPWPERYQPLLPAATHLIQEVPLPGQAETFQGPLVALAQALTTLETTIPNSSQVWALTLACDLPNLSVPVLQTWAVGLPSVAPHIVACLPHHQGRWEPLYGFYRLGCGLSLEQYSRRGGRSLQGWLATQPVTPLPLADGQSLINLNTPADLAHWQASQGESTVDP
ncbi:MAG: molybdenum cofactor guanylyltransferase [Nodosilinea sp.]